jgi:hypothetical protein
MRASAPSSGTTKIVSPSVGRTVNGNPNRDGRPSEMSVHESPASSLIDAAVILLVDDVGRLRMHLHVMHALPDLRILVGQEIGAQTVVARGPGLPFILGSENACRRDADREPRRTRRVKDQ